MHMTPQNSPDLWECMYALIEILLVRQAHGIDPCTADIHRLVVQGDKGRELRVGCKAV